MENTKKFAQGFIFKRPRENSPDFVKGSMSIKVMEAIEFLKTAESEWMNLDLLQSKDGQKLYFVVNDWKPAVSQENTEDVTDPSSIPF